MGVVFGAVGFVVGLGPGTAGKTFFGKQMYGVAQVLITSPALMALAMFAVNPQRLSCCMRASSPSPLLTSTATSPLI
jgi:hypothetical protein